MSGKPARRPGAPTTAPLPTAAMTPEAPLAAALYPLPDADIDRFLQEDVPYGDLTTILLGIGARAGRMVFSTRHETVACCTEEAARLLERVGCHIELLEPSGTLLAAECPLLEVTGRADSLHMGWKAALNLLEAASGIATRMRTLVQEARAVAPVSKWWPPQGLPGNQERCHQGSLRRGGLRTVWGFRRACSSSPSM